MRLHRNDRNDRNDGFTLVEVATATLILTVVAAGVTGLVDASVRGLARGRRQMAAVVLAQTMVERIEGGLSVSLTATYFDAGGLEVRGSAPGAVFVVRAARAGGVPGPFGWQSIEVIATPLAFDASRPTGPARLPDDVVLIGVLRGGP